MTPGPRSLRSSAHLFPQTVVKFDHLDSSNIERDSRSTAAGRWCRAAQLKRTHTRNHHSERINMGLFGAIFSGGDWDGWDTDSASEQGNLPGGDGGSAGQGGE